MICSGAFPFSTQVSRAASASADCDERGAEAAVSETTEQRDAIDRMVRLFYERGLADELLGPIFREAIHDWEAHIPVVASFWS